jgi:glycosyltransferase involved in cell wall biosynthesis
VIDVRIVIAHEWLVRYGGSERCVEEMCKEFPGATVLTSVIKPEALPDILQAARPSLLQILPGATKHHEWLLPLMPLAWSLRRPIRDVDAVISSSHACAKAVRFHPGAPHLCYCHTPMRYAWNFEEEAARLPTVLRPVGRVAMKSLKRWDRRSARRVTRFVANSNAVAERIRRSYGRTAQVIHPPVRTDFFTPGGEREDFFLYVGRFVSYKRPDLVIEAFADLPFPLVVVGRGQLEERLKSRASSNVRFVGMVNDKELRTLYRRARALVYPANEDFGIVIAEAQACGTPVIALAAGGALDIVDPGLTGWLVARQTVGDVQEAVRRAAVADLSSAVIRLRAERFSRKRFRSEIRAAVESMLAEGPSLSEGPYRRIRRSFSRHDDAAARGGFE